MASNEVKNLQDYLGDLRLSGAGHDQQNYLLERQWPEPLEPTAVQMGLGGEVTGLDCAVLVTRILLSYLEPAQRDPGLAIGDILVWLKTADLRSPILKWAWKNHPSLKGTDLLSEQRQAES